MVTALPRTVWVLGLASLFMDMSSELVHSLLPVFMVTVLGTSMMTVGLIEGVAEATASVTKVFSGALSDYVGKRKGLLLAGYGLAALSKPMFGLATSASWVFFARFIDRIGKGIRGAPRDALVADATLPSLRGAAYGLRQALDSVGAFLGPLLAVLFMLLLDGDIQAVMWIAVIPALITVLLLAFYVREPPRAAAPAANRNPLSRSALSELPLQYWLVVLLGALFTLARFSEAFLVLRAQDLGMALALVPVIMIVMNICYALAAYPAGAAADRYRPGTLLQLGLWLLIGADLVLAAAGSVMAAMLGAALWGFHMAFTQGLLNKLVADTAPALLRGTAFGFFNLVTGLSLLLANLIAGGLWDRYGPGACFVAGALMTLATALLLWGYSLYQRRQSVASFDL
jgi:MFS family permease